MILVTGGAGYIGSNTVIELLKKEFEVVIVDNLSNSSIDVINKIESVAGKKVHFENVDLLDSNKLKSSLSHYDIDAIIHFAAFKSVGESVENPISYYQNNIIGLINLLEFVEDRGIGNFVFSSSCTVYGIPDEIPVTEQAIVKETSSPYGNSKKISEELLKEYSKFKNLKVANLRYFNPIGSNDSNDFGDNPVGIPNNLMPYITRVATGELEVLNVFGDDYDTHDGSCLRDYIHVVDLANAHISAINFLLEKKEASLFESFNIGTGTGYSVFDLIKTFEKVTGVKVDYKVAPRRKGDIPKIYANSRKSNEVLGWKPEKSLDDMLSSSWNFQLKLSEK